LTRLGPVALVGKRQHGRTFHVTVCVLPDYLAIGPELAARIADDMPACPCPQNRPDDSLI
jgi:hypothetical protein